VLIVFQKPLESTEKNNIQGERAMIENSLFEQAKAVSQQAYAKYSHFPVGACLLTTSGEIFCGVNVENVSYPCGQCAEASAIGNMVTHAGPKAKIQMLVVMAHTPEGVIPCGNCLQRINEFSSGDTQILSASPEGIRHRFTLDELMPHRFSSI
jgi:cytidine deaminase